LAACAAPAAVVSTPLPRLLPAPSVAPNGLRFLKVEANTIANGILYVDPKAKDLILGAWFAVKAPTVAEAATKGGKVMTLLRQSFPAKWVPGMPAGVTSALLPSGATMQHSPSQWVVGWRFHNVLFIEIWLFPKAVQALGPPTRWRILRGRS
jgi:hypothetical protein